MRESTEFKKDPFKTHAPPSALSGADMSALGKTVAYFKTLQRSDGYWWFTLEANESIGAEFIFLMHYLGQVDLQIEAGIARRILDVQRVDGTWALYFDGPADLSTTIECYFALKLSGIDVNAPNMLKARRYITDHGGIEKARVFTRIHLAMFGIVPWSSVPSMPAEFILLPNWFNFNIYEFSSWARASIVPLLVFVSIKYTCELSPDFSLEELFVNPPANRDFSFRTKKGVLSWENFFIFIDKTLKIFEKIPLKPLRNYSINKCLKWIKEHVSETEDIYPALAYSALAFKAACYDNKAPEISKPFSALKMFHQGYGDFVLPALPDEIRDNGSQAPSLARQNGIDPRPNPSVVSLERLRIHQQCCISPVWDTPWMMMAMLDAQVPNNDKAMLKAGRWLIAKQIIDRKGDWAIKNPNVESGGWAFEFENSYFPDIDDTIEVLMVLKRLAIPDQEKAIAMQKGLDWVISMQNDDGGWGAFDKNQNQLLVNRIPFSDHGACLDPSSPDITGRMLELMAIQGFDRLNPRVQKAVDYIWRTQEEFGGWWARWGINYLYGTWCVLTGLRAIGFDMEDTRIVKAVKWLNSIQRADGGFGESPQSYIVGRFVPYNASVPSQTSWALMAMVAAGKKTRPTTRHAVDYLLNSRNQEGGWDENHYTGTGFPGHFYIRYHGYRHYFPLLALARYFRDAK